MTYLKQLLPCQRVAVGATHGVMELFSGTADRRGSWINHNGEKMRQTLKRTLLRAAEPRSVYILVGRLILETRGETPNTAGPGMRSAETIPAAKKPRYNPTVLLLRLDDPKTFQVCWKTYEQ